MNGFDAKRCSDTEETYRLIRPKLLPQMINYLRERGWARHEAEDLAESCISDIALVAPTRRPENMSLQAWALGYIHQVTRFPLREKYETRATFGCLCELPDYAEPRTNLVDSEGPSPYVIAVREAIEKLSESEREIVSMRARDCDGTFSEIAAELGITAHTVRARYARALNRLGKILNADPRVVRQLRKSAVR